MLCSGLDNRHCLLDTGEGEQICSVSRMAIGRNISTIVGNLVDLHVDTLHRVDDFVADRDINSDSMASTDVQSISGRDVQVADCRGLCRKTNKINEGGECMIPPLFYSNVKAMFGS